VVCYARRRESGLGAGCRCSPWRDRLLWLGTLTLFNHSTAETYHNNYKPHINPKIGGVTHAKRLVNKKYPSPALASVASLYPGIASQKLGHDPLADRALLITTRAVVRTDKKIPLAFNNTAAKSNDDTAREQHLG